MLRHILLKLPGFPVISDVPVSPYHVRMFRSLSPVQNECRRETKRNEEPKILRKRSNSFPSARPRSYRIIEGESAEPSLFERRGEQILQSRELHHRPIKIGMNKSESIENGKSNQFSTKGIKRDNKKNYASDQMSPNDVHENADRKEYDLYESSEQYELESAKPRRGQSELCFNVLDYLEHTENDPISHLQPSNLKPFGSNENVYYPVLLRNKEQHILRFPQNYALEEWETPMSEKQKGETDEVQKREYSTNCRKPQKHFQAEMPQRVALHETNVKEQYFKRKLFNKSSDKSEIIPNVNRKTELKKTADEITDVAGESNKKLRVLNQKSRKLPWTEPNIIIEPPLFLDKKAPPSLTISDKPNSTTFKTTVNKERFVAPWPSYSETINNIENDNLPEPTLESGQIGLPNQKTESKQFSIHKRSLSTEKVRHSEENASDNQLRKGEMLHPPANALQRRSLSTEPVVSLNRKNIVPVSTDVLQAQNQMPSRIKLDTKNYSKKSRPLEPTSCEKEKKPNKCFLPSKVRLQPPECTPKPKLCIKEDPCPPRADQCLKIRPKKLPIIEPTDCPCIEPLVPEINPKLKRLQFEFSDPPRVCPCEPCPCPPRADDKLLAKPKKLPPYPTGDCPCVEPVPLVDVPLIRLKKVCEPSTKCHPKRECPKEEPCKRADDNLKECPKVLPVIKEKPCPCVEIHVPEKNPKMRRLKFKFKDSPRECPCEPVCPCPPRADDNLVEVSKRLPTYKPGECACIEPPPMVDVPLKRLHMKCPPEVCYPKRICVMEPVCAEQVRADDCLKIKPKKLPILKPNECLCIEPKIPEINPKLKRLTMVFKDEPRTTCKTEQPCPPRADDSLIEKQKKLEPYTAGECQCIEPPPMTDVPLKRLQRTCVPEEKCYPQKKECPKELPCIRADKNLCVPLKKLPVLESKPCPCVEEPKLKDIPALKRLSLKVPEPPKVCPKPIICEEDRPRADDNWRHRPKRLPLLKVGDCPCIDEPLVDAKPLKRLKCKEEPEECVTEDPCVDFPRADWGCWEYYAPTEDKCKSEKKKKSINYNTRRKYNTDSRINLSNDFKNIAGKKVSYRKCVNVSNLKLSEGKNQSGAKKTKKSETNVIEKPKVISCKSTPIITLLNKLSELENKDASPITFKSNKSKPTDIKKRLGQIPCQNVDQEMSLQNTNVRNLSTDVKKSQELICKMSTGNIPNSAENEHTIKKKNKKHVIKRPKMCYKTSDKCPGFTLHNCVSSQKTTCEPQRVPVCCEKKPSPYPAFSEVMDEEVDPFSETSQWTCNRKEYGFHSGPKKTEGTVGVKNKKKYSTAAMVKNLPLSVPKSNPKDKTAMNEMRGAQIKSSPISAPRLEKREKKDSLVKLKKPSKISNTTSQPNSSASNIACIHPEDNHTQLLKQKSHYGIVGINYDIFPRLTMRGYQTSVLSSSELLRPQTNTIMARESLPRESIKSEVLVNTGSTQIVSRSLSNYRIKNNKFGKSCKKKKCPKFKFDNCPDPRIRQSCRAHHPVICEKPEAPFPSFTDCLDEELSENLSECPLEVKKVEMLQPRYQDPLEKKNIVPPVDPVLGKIDPLKEEKCIKEKLCMEKGVTQSCSDFGKFRKVLKSKDYIKHKNVDCEKIELLKRMGKWKPNNQKGFCTSTGNYFNFQKRGMCKFARRPNISVTKIKGKLEKETGHVRKVNEQKNINVRKYHVLCNKTEKNLTEDTDKNKDLYQHQLIENDDSCRYMKLRNVQWRINNFQKWHRLNKLSNLPGPVKRYYSYSKEKYKKYINVSSTKKSFSTSTSHAVSSADISEQHAYRGISTTMMLAQSKTKCVIKGNKKSLAKSKTCPKFTLPDCPQRKRFDCVRKTAYRPCTKAISPYPAFSECKDEDAIPKIYECPFEKEKIKRLQPQYPILPEIETTSLPSITFQDKIDTTIGAEYMRSKLGQDKQGLTQDCISFGQKLRGFKCPEIVEAKEETCSENIEEHKNDETCAAEENTEKSDLPLNTPTCCKSNCTEGNISIWQKIVNYFKARPNCPPPDEWKKKALREKAEKAAKAAGLILCDPKDMPLRKECENEDLPKVITPQCASNRSANSDCESCDEDGGDYAQKQVEKKTHHSLTNNTARSAQKRLYGTASNCSRSNSGDNESAGGEDVKNLLYKNGNNKNTFCTKGCLKPPAKRYFSTLPKFLEANEEINDADKNGSKQKSNETTGTCEESNFNKSSKSESNLLLKEETNDFESICGDSTISQNDEKKMPSSCCSFTEAGGLRESHRRFFGTIAKSSYQESCEYESCDEEIDSELTQENLKNTRSYTVNSIVEEIDGSFDITPKRYYSQNMNWRNIEEINKFLEEEEKKQLAKKILRPFFENFHILRECDDGTGTFSQKSFEITDDELCNKDNKTNEHYETDDNPVNCSCQRTSSNAYFLDVMFKENQNDLSGYTNAKAFATFREYFYKFGALSDISYDDIEQSKTNKLMKELDRLLEDKKLDEEN